MKNNKYIRSTKNTCELELKKLKNIIEFREYEERKTYNHILLCLVILCAILYVAEYTPDNAMLFIRITGCYLLVTIAKYLNVIICKKDEYLK